MKVTEDTQRRAQNVLNFITQHPEQHSQRNFWEVTE